MSKLGTFAVAGAIALGLAATGAGQDKAASPAAPQGMPPLPTPGPEHAIYKEMAGTWDAKVETFMDPAAPPADSPATYTRAGSTAKSFITRWVIPAMRAGSPWPRC